MDATKVLAGIAIGIVAVAAQQARAASVAFNFNNVLNPNYVDVIDSSSPFFAVLPDAPLQNVTASGTLVQTADFVGLAAGLGVGLDGLLDPGQSIDFHFDPSVSVNSISFTFFSNLGGFLTNFGDNATLEYSSDNGSTWHVTTPTITGFDPTYTITASVDTDVTDFQVIARGNTSLFGISGISVDSGSPGNGGSTPPAAPLPSAASMGVGALAMLGIGNWIRRRSLAC
jgi:hypothetical protein